jgi:hypothetical protein
MLSSDPTFASRKAAAVPEPLLGLWLFGVPRLLLPLWLPLLLRGLFAPADCTRYSRRLNELRLLSMPLS